MTYLFIDYITNSAKEGSQTQIFLSSSNTIHAHDNGLYFDKSHVSIPVIDKQLDSGSPIYEKNLLITKKGKWLFDECEKLTGIKYEYIATNIDLDKQSAVALQGANVYGKFADFSFNDIGSSTIGGGTGNLIYGSISYIGAGVSNTIIGDYDIIPGGRNNKIVDTNSADVSLADFSAILGGKDNTITEIFRI